MQSVDILSIPVSDPIYDRVPIEMGRGLTIDGYAIKTPDGEPNVDGRLGIPGVAECLGFSHSGLWKAISKVNSPGYKRLLTHGFSGEVDIIQARVGRIIKPVKAIKISDFDSLLSYADFDAHKPRARGLSLALAELGFRALSSMPLSKEEMAALIDQRICH